MFGPRMTTRTVAAAQRDLAHASPEVRASAARDLGRASAEGRKDAIDALVRTLSDSEGLVRAAAAEALAEHAPAEALEPLLACAESDENTVVRERALVALGTIGATKATARLRRLCEADEPEVRFQALVAHSRTASREDALATLLTATRDGDPLVVHVALRLTEELGAPDGPVASAVVDRCLELVAHRAPEVRAAAGVILARAGRREGHPILLALVSGELETTQAEDEAAAIELVGELGLRTARTALRRRSASGPLGLGGDRFAWHARVSLARLGDERQRRWILSELSAWNRERRTLAVAAAGRARLTEARDLLLAMRGDPNRADPEAIELALAELDRGAPA